MSSSHKSEPIYPLESAPWEDLHSDVIIFCNDAVATSSTLFTDIRVALFGLIRQIAEDLKVYDESANLSLQEAVDGSGRELHVSV